MKRWGYTIIILSMLAILGAGTRALAISSATVRSVQTSAGAQDVRIPVFINNEVEIRALTVPLLIRKLGPAYVDRIGLNDGERLVGVLDDFVYFNHYNDGTSDTSHCKRFVNIQPPSPGGFLGSYSYRGTEKQTVTGVPYGMMFFRSRLFTPNLSAGWDRFGSLVIFADINSADGCFEIDTTCVDPGNHLIFANNLSENEPAVFLQGTVHVGPCSGIVLEMPDPASLSPPDGTTGPQEVTLSWEVVPNAGGYEVQVDNTDATFHSLIANVTVPDNEYTLSLGAGETMYWRVRAVPRDCEYCFGEWSGMGGCVCPFQADYDADGYRTSLDLGFLIDILFAGGSDIQDPDCPGSRSDFDCDGSLTALDLSGMIDYLFANGVEPCNPCAK